MADPILVKNNGSPRAILRKVNDFGIDAYDLVAPPRRLVGGDESFSLVEANVDTRRVEKDATPSSLLSDLPAHDNWPSMSQRTAARALATFLIVSDPQRRLEARKAATLTHQLSLVQHIMKSDNLRRVLIADEVGLGKTIEAGLLVKQVLEQEPRLRILYLAPARLARNVATEFREKLDLDARCWLAGSASDARLADDQLVIASIQKAVFDKNHQHVVDSGPWDILIVDECHHLSDWGMDGGKPNRSYRLVSQLAQGIPPGGRLILMSGTPHQGSEVRFKNLLKLLSDSGNKTEAATGKVIYRTKDRVRDWHGRPLFPSREIRPATVLRLGEDYESWYNSVGELYDVADQTSVTARASGWAKGQALQWTASSVQAGLAFLCRLAIRRLNWTTDDQTLTSALKALRPFRGGPLDEPIHSLYGRFSKQARAQISEEDLLDDEEEVGEENWKPDAHKLACLIEQGVDLIHSPAATAKWDALERIITEAGREKIVLFAQPVETVSVVAAFLAQRYHQTPAIIIGNQSDDERRMQVASFQSQNGPQFLVSSKAGGEGLNMQSARRLVHLDVPWNPMELEQRVGRIHRFGSRQTIIVETLVVKGSREVDMYRIARERLRLIASQLDPEQFETLFGRVMSLVPPTELEEIVGNAGVNPPESTSAQIGRLVSEGYKNWQEFDEAYRRNAENINSLSAGEARWSDLGVFLTRFCGARPGPNSTITSFQFHDDEIVPVDQSLPTLIIDQSLYACGDAGGYPIVPINGNPVAQLGVNVPQVAQRIYKAFLPDRSVGAGYFRVDGQWRFDLKNKSAFGVLVFLLQRVRQEFGRATEEELEIKGYIVDESGERRELSSGELADLIRDISDATRIREPVLSGLKEKLMLAETELQLALRYPTDEERSNQVRRAVWPIAAVICGP